VARTSSGEGSGDSTKGSVRGQRHSCHPAVGASEREQTLADSEQTLADSEQTLADVDQTSSDGDQASAEADQVASDRDQAASDRELASGDTDPHVHDANRDIRRRTTREREQTGQARPDAATRRDRTAQDRDVAARARDRAADARDLTLAELEQDTPPPAVTDDELVTPANALRQRAREDRARAAEQRELAAIDRRAAARDREQAARERRQALVDREALMRQLELAETDLLTGVRTRAAGLLELDRELERCRRRIGGRLVAVYVDVIGLKTVNDSEGHAAGDELLKRVVAVIKKHLRPYDLIIRLGGDEFLCAISNMTVADAHQRFRNMSNALAAGGAAIRTGFAELARDESATALIARADHEMIDNHHGSRRSLRLS
jgi:diguanylate cyclase (GGDEF)-like protein